MKIDRQVYIVGSGQMGFDMTDPYDCHVYLFDAGSTYVLFDAGTGMGIEQTVSVCQEDGLDPGKINHLFLTHAHADHAGGAAHLRDRTDLTVYASAKTAKMVAAGDEEAICLVGAREGGIYPGDYVYRACPVEHPLDHGEVVEIGALKIEAVATPGHSHDHFSYLVNTPEKSYLISGDAIFFGGKIILQRTYDCNVPETMDSIQHLATRTFEALLPGHLVFSLKNGMRHIQSACELIDRFSCPPSIL